MSRNTLVLLFIVLSTHTCCSQTPSRKYRKIQKIIEKAATRKLPGVAVYVKSVNHPEWVATAGYSDLENKVTLGKEQIFSLGSIGKTYNATAALKLVDEGRIKLDDKISLYLQKEIISNLPNGDLITIRHLLGNTSGLYNYEIDPALNELYLSGKLKLDTLSHLNVLRRYVFRKTATAAPGTAYHYSSTNFMLLAMIIDHVVPEGHTQYLRKQVLESNGFSKTFYRQTPPAGLVNHYGDLNQDGTIENVSFQTIETTNWFIGDDGIYAPIDEAGHFLEVLLKGKLLSKKSLTEMTTWNNPKKPDYGLGLMADKSFPYKFLMGHSGRGIGTTTDLFYFPNQDMTVAIFCNVGLRGSSPVFKKEYLRMRSKIVKRLFLF